MRPFCKETKQKNTKPSLHYNHSEDATCNLPQKTTSTKKSHTARHPVIYIYTSQEPASPVIFFEQIKRKNTTAYKFILAII